MKTEIVTADNYNEIVLIEQTRSNDFNEDGITLRTICRGFVPYLIHLSGRNKTIKELFSMRNIDMSPTMEELFSEYFNGAYSNFDIANITIPRPSDNEVREQYLKSERKEFAALPKEYQDKYLSLFDEYMAWVTGQKIEAIKEYDSMVRATAFCIMLMLKAGKVDNDTLQSRKKIVSMVKDQFPERSGATVYAALRTEEMIYTQFEKKCVEFSRDYEYGKKLYKEKFPD